MSKGAAGVEQTWRRYWSGNLAGRSPTARAWLRLVGGGSGSRLAARLIAEAGAARGRVLDAGCGTGLVALGLAERGAALTLLDVSPDALSMARRFFDAARVPADFVEGSVFSLPFPDRAFAAVVNTGLLEHFDEEDRRAALAEMLRVADELVVTVNPNAAAPLYRRLKAAAERRGSWDVGYERPFRTLAPDVPPGWSLEERSTGWLQQVQFAKYLLPRGIRPLYLAGFELATTALRRVDEHRPGYLLVSILRRGPR